MNETARRRSRRAAGLAAFTAAGIVMSGRRGDFHVFDNMAEPAHGREIRMEDIRVADIAQAINDVMASQLRPWTAPPEVNQAPGVR